MRGGTLVINHNPCANATAAGGQRGVPVPAPAEVTRKLATNDSEVTGLVMARVRAE